MSRKHGVELQFFSTADRVDRRDVAIQTVGGYMRRVTPQGPALKVAPRFIVVTRQGTMPTPILVDGFEAGYVWGAHSAATPSNPNTRGPLKDGYYDHSQNCQEYVMLAFGPAAGVKTTAPGVESAPTDWGLEAWML